MRYELTDDEWAAIKPMLPNKPRGVPRVNDRRVLNGIFWVLRSGAPWRDLPDNFLLRISPIKPVEFMIRLGERPKAPVASVSISREMDGNSQASSCPRRPFKCLRKILYGAKAATAEKCEANRSVRVRRHTRSYPLVTPAQKTPLPIR
jgi:hypothetical protein